MSNGNAEGQFEVVVDGITKTAVLKEFQEVTSPGQFGLSKIAIVADTGDILGLTASRNIFLKHPSPSLPRSEQEQIQKKFQSELEKKELLERIKELSSGSSDATESEFKVVSPIAIGTLKYQGTEVPALICDYAEGQDLGKCGETWKLDDSRKFLKFARGLARVVQRVHNNGVVHSFIVPRHILKQNESYTLVGFGYSQYCDATPVERPTATYDPKQNDDRFYLAPEVKNNLNLGALWYPADIYSIGAILYKGITGKPPPEKLPSDVTLLKQEIYRAVKYELDKNGERIEEAGKDQERKLFTDNENIVKVLDRCLRHRPEDRYSCVEELIEALDIVQLAEEGQAPSPSPEHDKTIKATETDLITLLGQVAIREHTETAVPLSPLFSGLVENFSKMAFQDAKRAGRGHYEIFGHRDHLVNSLCRMLALANPNDVYCTWTLPGYWSDDNLGSNGRFLTMNKHKARKGVQIRRIFLVNHSFDKLTEQEQEILEAHHEAVLDCDGEKNFEVRVLNFGEKIDSSFTDKKIPANKEEALQVINNFEARNRLVAYMCETGKKDKAVFLNFISQGQVKYLRGQMYIERSIKKVRFWESRPDLLGKSRVETTVGNFEHDWGIATPLKTYIKAREKRDTLKETLALADKS